MGGPAESLCCHRARLRTRFTSDNALNVSCVRGVTVSVESIGLILSPRQEFAPRFAYYAYMRAQAQIGEPDTDFTACRLLTLTKAKRMGKWR